MTERLAHPPYVLVLRSTVQRATTARLAGVLLAAAMGSAALADPLPQTLSGTALRSAETTGTAGLPIHRADLIDLPALASDAFAARQPLVLMFSLRGCPWCDALRREHFAALLREQSRLGILVVEIDLSDTRAFSTRSPAAVESVPASLRADSPRELGRLHRVRLAPTILFIGPQGEVAERLVGYGSPDFFGAYLEQRIAQARAKLAAIAR